MMQGEEVFKPNLEKRDSEFDQYADSYKQLLSQSTGDKVEDVGFYARQKVRILKRLLGSERPPLNILDYGCGIGLSLAPLKEAFQQSKIYASDPSAKSLQIAASSSSAIPVAFEDLYTDKYQQAFDLIFTSCVFHHIDESEHIHVLSTLLKVTSPGGKLVIAEHNPWNPITQRMVNNCPFDEGVTLITMPVMKKRMRLAGWGHPNGRFMSFVPASYRQLGAIDLFLGWCPLGGQYMVYGIKE